MNDLLLAIDAGTESVRVGLFDAAGAPVASAARGYETQFPRSGWAEQAPQAWWEALATATRSCMAASGVSPARIAGISADATTCTLVPLGRDGTPLRPALLWMDVRAAGQAQRVFKTGAEALAYCPAGCSAEWMLPKVLWLKEHEPDVYAGTASFVEYLDWLMYRLTGRLALNLSTATHRWFYNCRTWGWPSDLFAAVGLPRLADKIPHEVLPLGAALGALSDEAARALGLCAGIPVFQGGGDAFVGMLGLGVAQPGAACLITGSSTVVAAFTTDEVHGAGVFGAFPDALVPGLWLLEAGQVSTGSILAWFKNNAAQDLPADQAFAMLDREAAQVAPGSGGLIVLDYFQGNRTPYTDAAARGAIWGLSLHSTRAHIFRAMMEGVAYGTRQILEVFAGLGCSAHSLHVCGGATRSAVHMQILADVCGRRLEVPAVAEAPLVGGAVVAATGAGLYRDFSAAAQAMVRPGAVYVPGARHAEYDPYFALYKKTYPRLRGMMHKMAKYRSNDTSAAVTESARTAAANDTSASGRRSLP